MGSRMTGMASQAYDAIRALEYRYARLLDEDRLEEWPQPCSLERGVYKVIPRENLDRQPALPIFFCDSQAMMVDRVKSLREANVYNLHYSRHVVSNIEILSARDGIFEVAACYTVYQTDLEAQTRLFSVGQYRDVIANGAGRAPGSGRRSPSAILSTSPTCWRFPCETLKPRPASARAIRESASCSRARTG